MISRWFHGSQAPIGIDIGTHHVRLMQVERQGDALVVTAAARATLPEGINGFGEPFHRELTAALRRMLDQGSFEGRAAVSCLPAPVVHVKNLRLPKMPPDELAAAVRWEANDRIHLGEPTVTQFIDAGPVRQGEEERQEVILLAATESVIDQHIKALTAAGLEPTAIDAIPTALARAVGRSDPQQVRVVIDAGYAQSKVLICRGESVLFYKQIDLGGRAFDKAVAELLSLPPQEAAELRRTLDHRDQTVRRSVEEAVRPRLVDLSREVGLCLRYYSVTFRGNRPDRATILGGEADCPGLAESISQGAALGVEPAAPFTGIDVSRAGDIGSKSDWLTALGLALRSPGTGERKRGAA